MNNYNPYKNFLLRIRRYLKEDINDLYDKLSKNRFLNFIFNHKKISIFIFVLMILLIISGLQLNNYLIDVKEHNNKLNGPTVANTLISKDINMVYSGDINYGKIEGNGELTLETESFRISFKGTFDNIKDKIDGFTQIGEFIEGKITINALNSNISYVWNGKFKDGNLLEGFLKINNPKENETTIYEGLFENGKLQGSGRKTLQKNNNTKTIIGWFDAGILKEE